MARECRGCGRFRPEDNPVVSASARQPCLRLRAQARRATAMSSPAWRSEENGQGWRARALRRRLCPSDELLRHSVGNCRRVAAAAGAFGPDLLEAYGNALYPLPDQACIAVADVFGADVDNSAG